jgi:hypothetical protein
MAVDLQPAVNFGSTPSGRRVLFAAAGGTFHGERLSGEILPNGGDWTTFRANGTMALDVRLTLRTDDHALILMTYGGRWVTPEALRPAMADARNRHQVDPDRYYFRTNPLFETGAERYAWLNDVVCVGYGYLIEGGVAYSVRRVD